MATETQRRTTSANQAERATKSDIAELSATVAQQGAELKWIRWTLGAMAVLLITVCGVTFAIALQI